MGTARKRGLSVVLAALVSASAPAFAQQPGVNVDPESPAGKEYGIPLEQARKSAGATSGTGAEGETFGAGIAPSANTGEPPRGGPTGGTGDAGAIDPTAGRRATTQASNEPSPGQTNRAQDSERRGSVPALGDPGGTSAVALTALIALAVLGGGGAVGLGIRRLRPR